MSLVRFFRFSSLKLFNSRPLVNQIVDKKYISFSTAVRNDDSQSENRSPTEGEKKLIDMLRKEFPKAKQIQVNDISGGCGSMYEVYVETVDFKNLRTVKQHQLVNKVLEKEIKNNMHGLRIFTSAAEN